MPVKEMFLIRHGESEVNVFNEGKLTELERFFGGALDCELTLKGIQEVRQLARQWDHRQAKIIVSSDLKRAWKTAFEVCGNRLMLPAPLLRERTLGVFEGHWGKALAENPEYRKYFYEEPFTKFRHHPTIAPPGGENLTDLVKRAGDFMAWLEPRLNGETVVACFGHGVFFKGMLCYFGLLPMEEIEHHYIPNASVTHLIWQDGKFIYA